MVTAQFKVTFQNLEGSRGTHQGIGAKLANSF